MRDSRRPDDAPATATTIDEAPPPAPGRVPTDGTPLPGDIRGQFEQAFHIDLSAVRVHTGPDAAANGALAYAQGADLHFAPGRFDPYSAAGRALLGHELAHVAQHAEGRAHDSGVEADADAMGDRAARGEAVRPATSRRLVAIRDPGAPILRMIENTVPNNGTRWDAIDRYLDKTLINRRDQTFTQAVIEFIACRTAGYGAVNAAWQAVLLDRGKLGRENAVLAQLRTIWTTINNAKRQEPDHPNKRGIGPDSERYETIPQSSLSQATASQVRTALLAQLKTEGKQRDDTGRDRETYRNPATGRLAWVDGHWADKYMLGVHVLPNGTIRVSHSGYMGTSQSAAFAHIVTAQGYVPATLGDVAYGNAQTNYHNDGHNATDGNTHDVVRDRSDGKNKVMNNIESGNPMGVCAAPQALEQTRGITSNFPAELVGATPMAMTEVWVASNVNSKVTVKDDRGADQKYRGATDVPSCLSCQFQLRAVMKKLVELRRNIENRDDVQAEARHAELLDEVRRLTAILATPQNQKAFVAVVGGGKLDTVPIGTDITELTAQVKKFETAIEAQAMERTQHPEHVEHDDKRSVVGLASMVEHEDATETNRHEVLLQKRQKLAPLIQPEPKVEPPTVVVHVSKKKSRNKRKGGQVQAPKVIEPPKPKTTYLDLMYAAAEEPGKAAIKSSADREEEEHQQAQEAIAAIDGARVLQGKLDGYVTQGRMTAHERDRLRDRLDRAVGEHDKAALALASLPFDKLDKPLPAKNKSPLVAKPPGKDALLAERVLVKALRELGQLQLEVSGMLSRADDHIRDERANDALDHAVASSANRDEKQRQAIARQEESQRLPQDGVQEAADESSARRHAALRSEEDQLWGLATMLAQTYDRRVQNVYNELVTPKQPLPVQNPNLGGPRGPREEPLEDFSASYIT